MFFKTFITALVSFFVTVSSYATQENTLSLNLRKIAILQILENKITDAVKDGIIKGLEDQGFSSKANPPLVVLYQSAQGNLATARQIAQNFLSEKPDVVIAISTPATQAVRQVLKNSGVPLVFAAVTDPVSSGIVPSFEAPGVGISGTSDLPPLDEQLKMVKQVLPQLQKLGVLYNPAETNARIMVEQIKEKAPHHNIVIVDAPVLKTSDALSALASILPEVDGILIPLDNTVASVSDAIIKASQNAGKPVFASAPDLVEKGAIAAFGCDHFDLGVQTGNLVVRLLKSDQKTVPVEFALKNKLFLNLKTAQMLHISIDKALLSKASKVFKD